MKNRYLRAAVWMLTVLMVLGCLPLSAMAEAMLTEVSGGTSAIDALNSRAANLNAKTSVASGTWTIPIHFYEEGTPTVVHTVTTTLENGKSMNLDAENDAIKSGLAEVGGEFADAKFATGISASAFAESSLAATSEQGLFWTTYYLYGDENSSNRVDSSRAGSYAIYVAYTIPKTAITLHDIQPDGSDHVVEAYALKDQTIEEAIDATGDGLSSGYIWHKQDGAVVDTTATATEPMELYTYTYRANLTLTKSGEAGTSITTNIDGHESKALTAADFIIDGVDLRLYQWKDENGNLVDLQGLIESGLTENITLTSDGMLASASLTEHVGHVVNFYVIVNDEPRLVSSRTVTDYVDDEGRHYLAAATLESAFAGYGFNAGSLSEGAVRFAYAGAGGATITCSPARAIDGVVLVGTVSGEDAIDVYYLPAQSAGGSGAYSDFAAVNSFYTVTVNDPQGYVYTADTLPPVTYHLSGSTATAKVTTPVGFGWIAVGEDGSTVSGVVANNETTFTIGGISQPYTIKPNGNVGIVYDVSIPTNMPPNDPEYGTPLVNGAEVYTDRAYLENTYTVLAPDLDKYFYFDTSGQYDFLREVTFLGWAVNGNTSSLLQPGQEIDLSQYAAEGGQITLTAQWQVDDGHNMSTSMVSFYVALSGLPEGTSAWSGSTDTSKFTQSVYTADCGVTGNQTYDNNLYIDILDSPTTQYVVLGGTSGTDLNAIHNTITSKLSSGHTVTGSNGQNYTFKTTFPSDESVLRSVRSMVASGTSITINGRTIAAEELTTANFTIKWYVFKADRNGWHIDGILVAKEGELKVSKTFAGDSDAVEKVKKGYSIGVSGGKVNTGKTLTASNADSISGNTYTWTLPVDQYYDYTITENNYKYTENLTTSSAQYRILNSVKGQNVSWSPYSSGVTVTGQGHNKQDEDRLTVEFLNTYTAPGTVVLQKIDAATGNLRPNVSFTIDKTMYDRGGGSYTAEVGKGTATNTITTNSAGQAYLWIGGGTYTLKEEVPTGYDDPGTITVTLAGSSSNNYEVIAIESLSAANGAGYTEIGSDLTMIVKNYSRTIDVRVSKIWPAGEEKKPVTLQLYRNELALGEDYTVTLDGTTNGWSHTFTDLPLYADGGLAEYTLREEAIGEFKYSDEYSDGYRYYDVNRSAMQYLDESGAVTGDMTKVKTVALSVSNERSNGSMSIAKVDETGVGLGGAEFYLYEAPSGEGAPPALAGDAQSGYTLSGATLKSSTTSAANGAASFANINAGRYFLIEHKAPTGYTGSTTVYELQFDGDRASMRYWDGDSWESTVLRVTNVGQTTSKTVTKIWNDNNNIAGMRPESVTLTLTGMVDDKVVYTQNVMLTADSGDEEVDFISGTTTASSTWIHEFTNVPLYSGGSKITYTVSENDIANYEATYDQSTLTVTNTLGVTDVTITKQITGNFADPNATFPFTAVVKVGSENVILDANTGYTVAADGTISFSLSDNGSVVIKSVPMQATVTVSETPGDYSASYQIGSNAVQKGETAILNVANGQTAVTFTNDRTAQIDTGVDLDTIPYVVMLLSIFGAGALWLIGRRRRTQN